MKDKTKADQSLDEQFREGFPKFWDTAKGVPGFTEHISKRLGDWENGGGRSAILDVVLRGDVGVALFEDSYWKDNSGVGRRITINTYYEGCNFGYSFQPHESMEDKKYDCPDRYFDRISSVDFDPETQSVEVGLRYSKDMSRMDKAILNLTEKRRD